MQIDAIEVFHVALPLKQPYQKAGRRFETLDTVLVRMRSGDAEGWGEASPGNGPLASAEWATGAFACLRDWLAPAVVGRSVDSGESLTERLEPFRGNRFAKAALDTAWWDLKARREARPLHQILGGQREAVELGVTFDQMESFDEFLAAIARAADVGFGRVKLKFRPGWDVRMVDFVRKEFPTLTLHVDVEGALGLEHMEMLCRLDDFMLAMIEQPLAPDDLVGHAMVQETIRTPICLDESITTVAQAEMALELHSCKFINLKPGRVGGLTPAVAIHDACRQADVACWIAAMPQSAIGVRAALALAAMANCTYPADYFPSDEVLEQDLAEPLLPARAAPDGKMQIRLWTEPGLGISPDAGRLDRFCIARAEVR
ncbi:MAG: o-succinylbenzoate synthase [Planctomycetes bacterium RBG_13_63_9]|nr:MAG: o-succinylbenzoate synthase [Planctomycetes bacterium RBG_13_63_9]